MTRRSFGNAAAIIAGLLLTAMVPEAGGAVAKTIYASVDGREGFLDSEAPIKQVSTLQAAINEAAQDVGESVTIQLLTQKFGELTVYRPSECAFTIHDIKRTKEAPLTVRGVRIGDRRLTEIAGETVADVEMGKGLCKLPLAVALGAVRILPEGASVRPEDLLTAKARIETQDKNTPIGTGNQRNLTRCFHVVNSSYITFEDLHFRDCWLPALYVSDSHEITLSGSLIEGSSYAFFAVSTGNEPGKSSGFYILNNIWFQDTSGFGPDQAPACREINPTADCPGDMWSKIPWGVTHDTLYQHMNGALFGSADIAGNVTLSGNTVRYAYNGIRMNVSDACKKDRGCMDAANKGVTIANNRFAYIRDNPVEPEVRAENWRIYGNEFRNSHGWISLDQVQAGPIYVWGNTGWYDAIPGKDCNPNDMHWAARQVVNFRDGGRWTYDADAEIEDLHCGASIFGTVLKVGDGERSFEKQVYVFHNSWMIRTPLVRGGTTGHIHHWNNAILYVGCGVMGDLDCSVPPPDNTAECKGMEDFLAPAGQSIVLRCVDPGQVKAGDRYDFRNDISSQGFPAVLKQEPKPPAGQSGFDLKFVDPKHGDFHLAEGSAAIGAGCRVVLRGSGGELDCKPVLPGEPAVDVGVFNAQGGRYEPPCIPENGSRSQAECAVQ